MPLHDLRARPGQFDKVVGNLRTLIAERTRLGVALPVVKAVFVAMRRNIAELPALFFTHSDLCCEQTK